MADIRISIERLPEPDKSLYKALMDFYYKMEYINGFPDQEGLRATQIVMTAEDIKNIFTSSTNGL